MRSGQQVIIGVAGSRNAAPRDTDGGMRAQQLVCVAVRKRLIVCAGFGFGNARRL